jgi:hypothetical protein
MDGISTISFLGSGGRLSRSDPTRVLKSRAPLRCIVAIPAEILGSEERPIDCSSAALWLLLSYDSIKSSALLGITSFTSFPSLDES